MYNLYTEAYMPHTVNRYIYYIGVAHNWVARAIAHLPEEPKRLNETIGEEVKRATHLIIKYNPNK